MDEHRTNSQWIKRQGKSRPLAWITSIIIGFILIVSITVGFLLFNISEIATDLANRILPKYAIDHTNIVVYLVRGDYLILDELALTGHFRADEKVVYRLIAKQVYIHFSPLDLIQGKISKVSIDNLVAEIDHAPASLANNEKLWPLIDTEPSSVRELLMTKWRPAIPIDEMKANNITINFLSNSWSKYIDLLRLQEFKGSATLGRATLDVQAIANRTDQPPISITLSTTMIDEFNLRLEANDAEVFSLKMSEQTTLINPKDIASYQSKNSDLLAFQCLFKVNVDFFNPWMPSIIESLNLPYDLMIAGKLEGEGQVAFPQDPRQITQNTVTWKGDLQFNINGSIPSKGVLSVESNARLYSQWKNRLLEGELKEAWQFNLTPDWANFEKQTSARKWLKLSDSTNITINIEAGARFQIEDNQAYNAFSDQSLQLSVNDTKTKSHYSLLFSQFNLNYLEELMFGGSFSFNGGTSAITLPNTNGSVELKLTDTQLYLDLTNQIHDLGAQITTQLFFPFDSNQMSFISDISSNNLPAIAHYFAPIINVPTAAEFKSGTLQLTLNAQGDENLTSNADFASMFKSINLNIKDASLIYNDIVMDDINLEWSISGMQQMGSETPGTITIENINIGLPLVNTALRFNTRIDSNAFLTQYLLKIDLDVELIESLVLGGRIANTEPFTFDPITPKGQLKINVNNLDITKALALNNREELYGTGYLNGALPITVDEHGITIVNGKLNSIVPGGEIHYVRDTATKSKIIKDASLTAGPDILENFHFDELSVVVDLSPDGMLHLENQFAGNNPNKTQGKSVNIKQNIDLNLFSMLKNLRLSEDIGDETGF